MASEEEWRDMLRDALDERVSRQDVEIAIRVDADPDYPLEDFDQNEFADWAAGWIDFTMASSFGPLMPGTNEGEWTSGDNEEVKVSLLLDKRTG
jgi:hypothetical protein